MILYDCDECGWNSSNNPHHNGIYCPQCKAVEDKYVILDKYVKHDTVENAYILKKQEIKQ